MAIMKHAHFLYFIFFWSTVVAATTTITNGGINWWCSQTPHYQTCLHYVAEPNPTASTIISINQFLDMTVQAAIDEARVVLKQAQGIEATNPNDPEKSLWASCVDYFDGTMFTLNMVLDHTLHRPSPLDVQTWISAGLTYIDMCEKGFELINITNTMLPLITTNLTDLLLNSLAISVVIRGSDTPLAVDYWNFSDVHKVLDLKLERPDVVVAQDGSGDFKTIHEAINSAMNRRRSATKRYVIYVKAGVYQEHVMIPKTVGYIKMYGDGIGKTIITGDRHLGGHMPTARHLKESATFQVWGRGFIGRDMTFRNTAGPHNEQAVAFLSGSDHSVVYHCSIEGYQDTLYTAANKQFYKSCMIFGTVDFIFGNALAVFQDCKIFIRKTVPGGGLVVTAHGRKYHNESTGYSLQGCKITVAPDLKPFINEYSKAFLGRPWHPYALTVYMQSFIDDFVDPQGWLDTWGYKETAFCGEYKNYGPGASTDQRVKWRGYHVINDPNIARYFTVSKFISGNQWLPETGVPYIRVF